ncbi:MAG: hypothetical protein JWM63_5552, partial [Gammaproteobacteria bacterium]|nr:hypothetical protein [Gammaproteobacteria bacterium]
MARGIWGKLQEAFPQRFVTATRIRDVDPSDDMGPWNAGAFDDEYAGSKL